MLFQIAFQWILDRIAADAIWDFPSAADGNRITDD